MRRWRPLFLKWTNSAGSCGPALINSWCRVLLQSADVSEQNLLMKNDYNSWTRKGPVEAGPLWRECITRPNENASTLITIGRKAPSFRLLFAQTGDLRLNCGMLSENYENKTSGRSSLGQGLRSSPTTPQIHLKRKTGNYIYKYSTRPVIVVTFVPSQSSLKLTSICMCFGDRTMMTEEQDNFFTYTEESNVSVYFTNRFFH
jgi:hypothetical protein